MPTVFSSFAICTVSLYTNDLFGQLPHDLPSGDVPSPRYQPTSAHSSPSRPQQQQQQQQQHFHLGAAPGVPSPRQVASPSRLGGGGSSGPPTSTQGRNMALSSPGRGSGSSSVDSSVTLQRPSTAPVDRPSPLRTSAIALSALRGAAAGGGSSHGTGSGQGRPTAPFRPVISLDSPRLKQLLGQGFAPAVPASTSASPTTAPGPLSGTAPATADLSTGSLRQQWSAAAARPATPSFQPLSTSLVQPTSSSGAAPVAADDFTIRTSFHANDRQQRQQQLVPSGSPLGSYPIPPATAPAKAASRPLALGASLNALQQPKTGFALYGISPAAFVLAGPGTPGPSLLLQPPLLATALASAALASGATLRAFLLSPGPADLPLQCRILRSRGGLFKGGSQYRLVLDGPGGASAGGRVLLAARKRTGAPAGARYDVSCSPDDFSRRGPSLCARLRSNFLGTEFGAAVAGERVGQGRGSGGGAELVAVAYQPNVLGTKGPRRMTALIPRLAPSGSAPAATPARSEAESLLGR